MSSPAKILAFLVLALITSAENTESFNNLDEKTQNLAIGEFTSLPGENFQMDNLRLSLNEEKHLDIGILFYEHQDLQTAEDQNVTESNQESQQNETSTNSTDTRKDSSDGFAVYYVIIVIFVVAISILATAYLVYRNKSTTNDNYVRV